MKYYKLIKEETIIGAVSSDDFICYVEGCGYVKTNEQYGEFADFEKIHYRTTWMKAPHDPTIPYIEASFLQISKEEYDIFMAAIHNNEEIDDLIDDDEPEESEIIIDPIEQETIDFIRSSKLKEMSYACRTTIEAGFDLDIHDEKQHFSLTTQDQLNLMSLGAMAQTQSLIPYHADGEQTTFYTSEEINEIVDAANSFKIYHTTYYNALKDYINSLETIEEISAITYGVEIPEEYKSNVLKILEE